MKCSVCESEEKYGYKYSNEFYCRESDCIEVLLDKLAEDGEVAKVHNGYAYFVGNETEYCGNDTDDDLATIMDNVVNSLWIDCLEEVKYEPK